MVMIINLLGSRNWLPWETQQLGSVFRPTMIKLQLLLFGWAAAMIGTYQYLTSEQMYLGMKRLGRETQLVVYPDEYHGLKDLHF
jgi:hypothetical protein